MKSDIEFPACPICHSDRRTAVYEHVQDWTCGIPGHFTIVRCLACGFRYLCPRPSPERLGDFYPDNYVAYGEQDAAHWSPLRRSLVNLSSIPYRLRYGPTAVTLAPFGRRRMLDVGCGAGYHMADMRRLGWNVYGVDFDRRAVEAANAALEGTRVWLGTVSDVPDSVTSLDLVTMHHLVEHVPDPMKTLQEAHQRLRAQGRLHVIVPNNHSREAQIFGRYWTPLEVPRHLNYFTETSLRAILGKTGFQVERIRPQFLPWMIRASFDRAVDIGLCSRWQWLKPALYPMHLTVSPFSYLVGNFGVLDVLASKKP